MRNFETRADLEFGSAIVADGSEVARTGLRTPQLSVVIVNFCQWRNTARLVKQLRQSDAARSGTADIVIVDNHSPQHALRDRLAKTRGVRLLLNDGNHGFARAVNRGCNESRSEWVLLLNPDVTVEDGFLDDVQKRIDIAGDDPTFGVIGFQLRNSDGTRQASAGPLPTFAKTVMGLFRPRSRRKCRHQVDRCGQVDWVTGGCMLIRRECLDDLGGLDERYFLYYEDVDFCRRATERGWSVWYEPAVSVTHHSPLHSRQVPAALRLVTRHALLTYAQSAWPRWQTILLAKLIAAEARVRSCLPRSDQKSLWQSLRKLPADVLRGNDDAIAERLHHAAGDLRGIAAAQDRADG